MHDILEAISPDLAIAAARGLLRRVERGRNDPAAFFELVAREEHDRTRIRAAPHQRVLFDFVSAHRRALVRAFAGSSKTFCLGFLGLHMLGREPTGRGAIIGATAGSAAKVLTIPRDYVKDERGEFPELHLVFPRLAPSPLSSDPWGQQRITVERPAGIRDPSFVALGEGSDLPGARLKWIIVDDILDEENTATPEARAKLKRNFGRKILTRLDVRDAHIVVLNTPWEPDDLTFALEASGEWPCLSMEVEGEVRVTNTDWTSPHLRPSRLALGAWRLKAHDSEGYGAPLCELLPDGGRRAVDPATVDPGAVIDRFDVDEKIPLWPEKFGVEQIEQLRKDHAATPGEFQAKYKLRPRVPADETRKRRWIQLCKDAGRALGIKTLATRYQGPGTTYTGVDVATGLEDGSDLRAIFTFAQLEELNFALLDGTPRRIRNARVILDVQIGRWAGIDFIRRIVDVHRRFGSLVRVETNGAQDLLRQWLVRENASIPIKAHVTGESNKHARVHGVAGVMIELENLGWVIPCNDQNEAPPAVEQWIAELLDYRPDRHPGDALIASWLAREQARAVLGDRALPVDLATVAERFRS